MINDQLTEARLHMQLKEHPNIVRFFDCFVRDDTLCIVQEYCDRGDLRQYVALQRAQGVQIREARIRKVVVEVLLALDHIHSFSVVHRDLKPSNLFLRGRNLEVKIGDFGVS